MPVIRLKKVVLPAPFGPMIELMLFSSMPMLTSRTARMPPNDLLRFLTSSSIGLSLVRVARIDFGGDSGFFQPRDLLWLGAVAPHLAAAARFRHQARRAEDH